MGKEQWVTLKKMPKRGPVKVKGGIPLTQVTTTCSVQACGRLSSDARRLRGPLRDRGRVSGVSHSIALAGRVPLPCVRAGEVLARAGDAVPVRELRPADLGHRWHDLSRYPGLAAHMVPRHVVGHQPEDGRERNGPLQRILGLGSYETAWTWLHKLRRAMVRPGRDRLSGTVEVDETYLGATEKGVRGRQTQKKALIAVAAEEVGAGIGRIRMRRIPDASADSLQAFVEGAVTPGSVLHTDGLLSYDRLEKHGYGHQIIFLKGKKESPAELLPRVHRVVSLLKRWLLGTHQGAVSQAHLDYYLDEFTFRFNRRTSRHRGKLFYRLVQQAVGVDPAPYPSLIKHVREVRQARQHRPNHN